MDVGNEFQSVGPDTEKPRSPYRVSRQHGSQRSWREHGRRHELELVADTRGAHICEIRWSSATKALADQCSQLKLDALSHRKPMEVVSYGTDDMVELPLAGDESRH